MAGKIISYKEKAVDFKKIGAIVQKNFIVIMRDKARILPLLLFPIFMIMVFGFTSGNTPKHIATAIIPYDSSMLSQRIQQEISNSDVFSIRKVLSTEGEGKKLLDKGEIKVLVEIPPNLQEKIDSGEDAAITVVVDESDSSVSSISKQTLNAITSRISKQLSLEKISYFQESVESSFNKVKNYNSATNQYAVIAGKVSDAQSKVQSVNDVIAGYAYSLESSLTYPTPFAGAEIKYGQGNSSFNVTYLPETPAYLGTKAQIAVFRQSSSTLSSAENDLQGAKQISSQQDEKMQSSQNYKSFHDNVAIPSIEIQKFSSSKPEKIIQPLSYEEKPAYGTGKRNIDFLIPSIIALTIFQGAVMGMGRAVAGEKNDGSLTRVFLTPTSNITIVLGTLIFYIIFEIFRSSFLILIAMGLFSIKIEGSLLSVFAIVFIYAGVSTAIGMFISSLVKTEQQYFGMAMLVSMPTLFLAGAFFPIQSMPKFLQAVAAFLPVTYAADALRGVMIKGFSLFTVSYDIFILTLFLAITLGACFMVFKRNLD